MSSSGNVCHASFKNMCLALQIAVKPVAVCVAVFAESSSSLKPTKYLSGFWPEDVSVSAFLSVSFLLFLFFSLNSSLFFNFRLLAILRCFVELVIMWCPEDAHHPGRFGRSDQRCDHPTLRLGHLPAHARGPQTAPTLLPGSPQCHRLSAVGVSTCSLGKKTVFTHFKNPTYNWRSLFLKMLCCSQSYCYRPHLKKSLLVKTVLFLNWTLCYF